MTRPSAVFDDAEKLLPDHEGPRMYGNVSNRLELRFLNKQSAVAIAVPTMLFSFMRDVAKVPIEASVNLVLEEVLDGDDHWYIFSMITGDDGYDLWVYSRGSLPAWLRNPHYAIR